MAKIAIIDDDVEQSDTVKKNMEIAIAEQESNLETITSVPFEDPNQYFDFINNNDVCVLVLDEKLNAKANGDASPVDYLGSDLVSILRTKLKELPIFAITNYSDVEELKEKYAEYDDIINRKDFLLDTDRYFPKLWRAAKNYLNENEKEFSEFNELTKSIAAGNKSPDLIRRLQALQAKLDLELSGFNDRNSWLNEYETQINSLEELNKLIQLKIDSNKK